MLTQITASSGRRNRLSPCDLGERTKGTTEVAWVGLLYLWGHSKARGHRTSHSVSWARLPAEQTDAHTLSKADPQEMSAPGLCWALLSPSGWAA